MDLGLGEEFNSVIISGSLLKKSFEDSKKTAGERAIKGYASVPIPDLENEIIAPTAYKSAINAVKDRVKKGRPIPIFIEHRRKELSLPVGSVTDAGEDDHGLWFRGKIAKGTIGDTVWDLIKENVLYSVSMGGEALKKHRKYDNKINKDVTVIDDLVFRELSLTGLPVNEEAVFDIAKSVGSKNKEKFSKEVMENLKKLNKAIDFEKSLLEFEKATDELETNNSNGNSDSDGTLNEGTISRIEEAMSKLAQLLGIKSSSFGNTEAPQELETPTNVPEEPIPNEKEPTNNGRQDLEPANNEVVEGQEKNSPKEKNNNETIKNNEGLAEEITDVNSDISSENKKQDNKEEVENIENKGTEEPNIQENDSKKLDQILKLVKRLGGEKSVEMLKCQDCGSVYEDAEYEVNFCPKCGNDFNKSEEIEEAEEMEVEKCSCKEEDEDEIEDEIEDEENDEGEADEDALFCKACETAFVNNDEYEMIHCPKCGGELEKGLASIAVATQPQGAKTKRTDVGPEKTGGPVKDTQAVAPNPQGSKTKWTKAQKKMAIQKDLELEQPEKTPANKIDEFKGPNYIPSEKGEPTVDETTAMHGWDSKFQRFVQGDAGEPKVETIDKSLDSRLEKIEKSLETISKASLGKRSKIVKDGIEKSVPSANEENRFLAKVFLGKLNEQ